MAVLVAAAACAGAAEFAGPAPRTATLYVSTVGTIAPASTSVTLFVGAAAGGRVGEPLLVRSWLEFIRAFGELSRETELGSAVRLYFLNGGREALVVRAETGKGGVGERAVASALGRAKDFNIVCLPGVEDPGALRAAAQHCQERGATFLPDLPEACDTAAEADRWLSAHPGIRQSNVAAYVPWINIYSTSRRPRAVPPSGAIAGIIARTDIERGVWKAPAGTEAEVRGAVGLTAKLNADETDALTQLSVNTLRALPDGRVVVWGARTLSEDTEWRYVPVRRLSVFLEESISEGTRWVVFEPNDEPLWAKLRSCIGTFMQGLFSQGAFQGSKASDAYFVKCDRSTMTNADIQGGVCNVLVGFAPLKPAEFVVLRIQQKTAGKG